MADPVPAIPVAAAQRHHHRTASTAHSDVDSSRSLPHPPLTDSAMSTLDPDTCRICRGEATTDEPLFYPCKCSGSIKYVHQNCLMEWLSHSQKKHCELCKTSFRFTKLYSPTMPKTLPHLVFATHVVKYIVRDLLIWLRGALVVSVWLIWLPYLMRSVWAFLFWISDEGLGGGSLFSRSSSALHRIDVAGLPPQLTTCPASPLWAANTSVASVGNLLEGIALDELRDSIFTGSIYGINVTTSDPVSATLLRYIFASIGLVGKSNRTAAIAPSSRHPSLLSDVSWLKNLTRSRALNHTVITVLEGQIITVLVIVCFILIILVRDYVVQQQPEINMRAAFAAQDNQAPIARLEAPHAPEHDVLIDNDEEGDDDGDNGDIDDIDDINDNDDDDDEEDDDIADRDDDALGRDALLHGAYERVRVEAEIQAQAHQTEEREEPQAQLRPRPIAEFQRRIPRRPNLLAQERLPAILDAFEERRPAPTDSSVSEYLRIYRKANGDPAEILRIIEEEQLDDRLEYWVGITQSLLDKSKPGGEPSGSETVPSDPTPWNEVPETLATSSAALAFDEQPPSSTPSKPLTPSPLEGESWATQKRKEKASETWDGPADDEEESSLESDAASPAQAVASIPTLQTPNPLKPRARAVSDGPPIHEGIHPLANNSWSFARLPSEPPASGPAPISERPESSGSSQDIQDSPSYPTPPSSTAVEQLSPSHPRSSGDESENLREPHPSRPNGLTAGMEVSWSRDDTDRFRTERDLMAGDDTGSLDVQIGLQEDTAEPRREDLPAGETRAPPPPGQHGLVGRVADFMWGGVEPLLADNEALDDADDLAENGRDGMLLGMAIDDADLDGFDQDQDQDAAAAAGLDPEAIEDAEDLEGILELIGMRGPIAGLFQNAIFCAVLVSVTIFLCIFIPYNIGRMTVWAAANPTRLMRMAFSVTKFVQDLLVASTSLASCTGLSTLYMLARLVGWHSIQPTFRDAAVTSWGLSVNATNRVLDTFVTEFPIISASEMQNFSAISHEALCTIKDQVSMVFSSVGAIFMIFSGEDRLARMASGLSLTFEAAQSTWEFVRPLPTTLMDPSSWVISFSVPEASVAVNPELAYWTGMDRFWAILCGYFSVSFMAGLYLRRGTPFSSGQLGQEWEASIIDLLKQASGVMKVILIISIEMLIFPLYCGLLLDVALLPLFENTTMRSRVLFTLNFPLTSIFVHWFVGTGYMFHFALFVSMCRKIMRRGVLYFIRDPDDPEFHPVRDVLERNVTTQLRKILFSAFVYGALVIVCLGGVVWGLSLALPNVLPIHYSSNEPVLEFPIDLLFYNFLMPLAVKFFKPSDGLHAMYTWWFRKCARGLRVTWFLFGERRVDEEGTLVLARDSPHRNAPWWRRAFLEIDAKHHVVPKTWKDTFEGGTARPATSVPTRKLVAMTRQREHLVNTGQMIPDGRFVRTPASDQVKIPKGQHVFLDVDQNNTRRDGKLDAPDTDLYSTGQYQLVYVPPHFRLRVFLFILFIWLFAAVTGVGFTIVPLIFGRRMFKLLIPAHIRTNDIYAFSIGIYILGSAAYSVFHLRSIYVRAKGWLAARADRVYNRDAPRVVAKFGLDAARLAYAYTILLFVFPLLLTALMELYVIIPLHTYMYPLGTVSETLSAYGTLQGPPGNKHTVRVIQVWTLGLLYLKLGVRLLTTVYDGRPVAILATAVLRRGWLQPNAGVLTRAFVIPGLALGLVAIGGPPTITGFLLRRGLIVGLSPDVDPATLAIAYRLSYPAAALSACGALALWSCVGIYKLWQVRIRDEAYLIGERLHNFGVGAAGGGRGRRAWRAGGPRL